MPLTNALASHSLTIVASALIFVLAGTVKGLVGLGLPTVAMALLVLVMPPAEAAAMLTVPSFLTNIWQCRPWNLLHRMLVWLAPMLIGVSVGALGAAWLMGAPAGAWGTVSLGFVLIAYSVWSFRGAKLNISSRAHRWWLGPLVGVVTGVITTMTGVFVIPAVPYLQALARNREELIQAMGLSFTVSTIALAIGLHINDEYTIELVGLSLLMIFPSLIGMALGQNIRQRLSLHIFRMCFLLSLLLLGAYLIFREIVL